MKHEQRKKPDGIIELYQETKTVTVNGKVKTIYGRGRIIPAPDEHFLKSTGIRELYEMAEADERANTPDDGLIFRQALFTKDLYMKQGIELPEIEKESRTYVMNWLIVSQGVIDGNTAKPAETETAEQSKPLAWNIWAGIFGISTATLRKARETGKYHFRKVSERRWTLPISELPAEYLERYSRSVGKKAEPEREIEAQI